jgi:adenylate kinase family enzyme
MDFKQISCFERINVVGTSGSGKTTFARELAELLNLPCYEMDQLFWKADWQESSDDELSRRVHEVTSRSRWVLDGNYSRTIPIKWKKVQLVIWLDPSFVRTVFQVTKRTIRRSLIRQEIWPGTGNRESLRKAFLSNDSIIWWAITTYRNNRNKYSSIVSLPAYSHICFIRLNSRVGVASFLKGLREVVEQSHAAEPTVGPISSGESSPPAR